MNEYIREERINETREKRKKSSSLNKCGKMMILFMLMIIAFQAISKLFLPKGVMAVLCTVLSFFITFCVVCGKERKMLLDGMFVRVKGDKARIMGGLSDCMFWFTLITLCLGGIAALFDLAEIDIFSKSIQISIPVKGFDGIFFAFYMCLIAPVIHEIIFRGVVIKSLEGYGEKTVVFVSALLYALLHGSYITNIYVFAMGMIFGKILVKSKSLLTTFKLNIICSLLIYSIMFAVSENIKFLYIPLFMIFGFFAIMGLLRRFLGIATKSKKQRGKINFKVVGSLAVAGTAILMIAEDILFLVT